MALFALSGEADSGGGGVGLGEPGSAADGDPRPSGVIPYVRSPDDGSAVLFLLVNGALDDTGEFEVRVRGAFGSWAELDHASGSAPAARDWVRANGGRPSSERGAFGPGTSPSSPVGR